MQTNKKFGQKYTGQLLISLKKGEVLKKFILNTARFSTLLICSLMLAFSSMMIISAPKVRAENQVYQGCDLNFTPNYCGSGSGTEEDPYLVIDCWQLYTMSFDEPGDHYLLENDLDCDGVGMIMVGTILDPFQGIFDGDGHKISNVSILNGDPGPTGIFAATENATIKNLYLDNVHVEGTAPIGALIGSSYYTTVTNVRMTNSSVTGENDYAGGLVGELGGSSISRSYAEDTTVTGDNLVGGLAGIAVGPSTISDSYFQGIVDGDTNVGGITGQVGAGPAYVANTYADVDFINSGSEIVGAIGSGAWTINNYIASAPYLENSTQSPMDTWDFEEIWYVRANNYPGLRLSALPYLLCEEAIVTEAELTAACSTTPALTGPTTWEIQYGFAGSEIWTELPNQSGTGFSVNIEDLLEGSDYQVRFRYINDMGTSQWGRIDATTLGDNDLDDDGKSNMEEDQGPNDGDANNDGTQDYLQATVTSFVGVNSGKYVVLQTSCSDNFNVQIGTESSESKDSGYDYPAGLVGFIARGCSVGTTANFKLYFYDQNSAGLILRKRHNNSYITVPNAQIQQLTIGGHTVTKASYQVTDGGSLDDDGVADGNIVDPVGLAQSIVGVPNTGIGRLGKTK